jgi:hypothetical protein
VVDTIRLTAIKRARVYTTCRACKMRPGNRSRGLCNRCWTRAEVRRLFGPASKHGKRGLGNGNAQSLPLPMPTDALPGSPAKLKELARRAESGLALWNPNDGQIETATGAAIAGLFPCVTPGRRGQ